MEDKSQAHEDIVLNIEIDHKEETNTEEEEEAPELPLPKTKHFNRLDSLDKEANKISSMSSASKVSALPSSPFPFSCLCLSLF